MASKPAPLRPSLNKKGVHQQKGLGFRVQCLGLRVRVLGFRV